MVRIALWALRIYLLVLLSLIALKFTRVFSGADKSPKPSAPFAVTPAVTNAVQPARP